MQTLGRVAIVAHLVVPPAFGVATRVPSEVELFLHAGHYRGVGVSLGRLHDDLPAQAAMVPER